MKFDKRPRFKQKRASELIVNATAASAAPFKPGLASDGPSPSESRPLRVANSGGPVFFGSRFPGPGRRRAARLARAGGRAGGWWGYGGAGRERERDSETERGRGPYSQWMTGGAGTRGAEGGGSLGRLARQSLSEGRAVK